MNYSRNMPDWQQQQQQQYNTLQTGEQSDRQAASIAQQQTVQPGAGSGSSTGSNHLFSLDCLTKSASQQNVETSNGYYTQRATAQQAGSPSIPAPPPSMALHHHMTSYGSSGLGVIDAAMGEELQQQQQRSVQMSLNSPTSRIPSTGMTVNSAMGSMGQIIHGHQAAPSNPMAAGIRQATYPSACKGNCCQSTNASYRWDKMNPYQANPYRESMHPSAAAATAYGGAPPPAVDGRSAVARYRSEVYRKETATTGMPVASYALDQQQQSQQQQRRYSRKESSQMSRGSYHHLPPNYPGVQGYGYPPPPPPDYHHHHQKYYSQSRGGTVVPQQPQPGQSIMKYPAELAMQEKYLQKPYQPTPNGTIMQNGVMVATNPAGVPVNMGSPYFNPQIARDLPGEYPCKAPDSKDQDGRLIPPPMSPLQNKHLIQQKLQTLHMQRLNLEKHLREFSNCVPAYQNHPRYQELLMKHRETVRLMQTLDYQLTSIQTATAASPINLQFDQNGHLINSSLMAAQGYGQSVQTMGLSNPLSPKDQPGNPYDGKAMQAMEHALQQAQQHHQLTGAPPPAPPPSMMQPSPEQHHTHHYLPHEYHPAHHLAHHHTQHHHRQQHQLEDESAIEARRQKASKDFADKPELDVRQFLANWDETEEEDQMNGMQNGILTEDTPIVVLEYEDLNLASEPNLTTGQTICVNEKDPPTVLTIPPPSPATKSSEKDQMTSAKSSEQIPATVNIIHCITSASSNSEEEVPTIHIVDTLENEAVVKKIEGAFHSLNSAEIKSIEELVNKGNGKEERISLSFLNAATILQAKELDQKSSEPADRSNDVVTATKTNTAQSPPIEKKQAEAEKTVSNTNTSTITTTSSTVTTSNNDLSLGTSATFVNEDTRHNDDLSLPELPTSECTPISTTLNTPNHSDNEESSSERVRAMSISANSMEIMPGSPMISFAHSPVKFQKDSTNDELQFDFQNSNEASNSVGLKEVNVVVVHEVAKEVHEKNAENSKSQILSETANTAPTANPVSEEQANSSIIDTAVFEFSELSNSSSFQLGEEPKMPVPPMEGNPLTKIIKDTPPITNLRVLDSDDDLKVNDIWMDINLDASSLQCGNSSNSANKSITSEEKQVQTENVSRHISKSSTLRHFRKNKGSSDRSKESAEVVETECKGNKEECASAKPLNKERHRKSLDSSMKQSLKEKPKKRAKSVEMDDIGNEDQEKLLKEFKNLKRKKSIGQMQDDIKMLKSSIDELRNLSTNNNVNNNAIGNKEEKEISATESNVCNNGSLPLLPDTKVITTKRRFSSIFDPIENLTEKPLEETTSKNCIDSDIKIQLPNMNLEIKDKKETSTTNNNVNSNEGIKIEINVSRVESQRSHDNEIVSKSNQQLNISLPPASPMSCKVDCYALITSADETEKLPLPICEDKAMIFEKENEEMKVISDKTKDDAKEDNNLTFVNKNTDVMDDKCLILENKESEVDNIFIKNYDKKECDIENALRKLEEYRRNSIHEEKDVEESQGFKNKNFTDAPGCSKDLDFDNFDVEPFDDRSDDYFKDLLHPTDKDHHNQRSKTVGYLNPLFHLNELENLDNVPVYTTKDGKITYSPNPNYTYRALIIEARQREGHALFKDLHDPKSGKRNRYSLSKSHDESHKKHKSSYYKYKHDGKRDKYCDDDYPLSFENCLTKDSEKVKICSSDIDEKKIEELSNELMDNLLKKDKSATFGETRLSPIPLTPPLVVLNGESSSRSMPLLDNSSRCHSLEREVPKNVNRCIVDLQNLKDDIMKKLNDQDSRCHFETEINKQESVKIRKKDRDEMDDEIFDKEIDRNFVSEKTESVVENDRLKYLVEDFQNDKDKKTLEHELFEFSKENKCVLESVVIEAESALKLEESRDMTEKVTYENETIVNDSTEMSTEVIKESAVELIDTKSITDVFELNKLNEIETVSVEDKNEHKQQIFDEKELGTNQIENNKFKLSSNNIHEDIQDYESLPEIKEIENNIPIVIETRETTEKIQHSSPPRQIEIENETIESESIEPCISEKCSPEFLIPNGDLPVDTVKSDEERAWPIENRQETSALIEQVERHIAILEGIQSIEDDRYVSEIIPSEKRAPEEYELPELTPIIREPIEEVVKSEIQPEVLSNLISIEDRVSEKQESVVEPFSSPNFSAELCDKKRPIPKLVIRKSDSNSKIFSKSKSIDLSTIEESKKESNSGLPKIPKMIIRNAKSRPATPSIEEVSGPSHSDHENKPLKIKIKREENSKSELSETKIPKMKIKLHEEKQPRVVIEQQKTVPKMKITNVKGSKPKIMDEDTNSDNDITSKERKERSRSRLKKDSSGYSSEGSLKRSSSSSSSQSKRAKRSPRDEPVSLDPNLEDTQFLTENEYKQKNTSKVPKVIIKRASPTAEFKCELSKDAIVNAQPRVILKRSSVLDCMAKDLRHMKFVVKVSSDKKEKDKKEERERKCVESNELEWRRFISGLKKRREFSRSNSTPDLNRLSPKIKRRRTSDICIGNLNESDSDSGTRFAFHSRTKSDNEAEMPRLSDLPPLIPVNQPSQVHAFSSTESYWRTLDENMNKKSLGSENQEVNGFSGNKLETIIEASDSISSELTEKQNSTEIDEDVNAVEESQVQIEENSALLSQDDSELLNQDLDVHEEEVIDESSVIKVDSSDESQTTIEILPASPSLELDENEEIVQQEDQNIVEARIYGEDAVPMHFEYELEVESSGEQLAVPLTCSENETDKSSSAEVKQIPGILIHEQLVIEDTSGNTSISEQALQLIVEAEDANIPIKNDFSKSENSSNFLPDQKNIQIIEGTSSTSASLNNIVSYQNNNIDSNGTTTTGADEYEEKTNCSSSDLLVKEVLAAKETLKKYLGSLSSVNLCNSNCNNIDKRTSDKTKSEVSQEKEQSTSSSDWNSGRSMNNSLNYSHKDKKRKLSRGKCRSSDSKTSRTLSPSSRNSSTVTTTSSTKRAVDTKTSPRHKTSEAKLEHRISSKSQTPMKPYKIPKSTGKSQLDPLMKAVEENLRYSARTKEKERSPSVISSDNVNNIDVVDGITKRIENVISEEALLKAKALQLSPEMTISKIMQKFVFHEKATIRHRRYCMLCEKWFPSSLRHRRHLAGYQHRQTELAQRRAIHMLFLIFTGKLCPKLLPPDIVRTDCIPGEPTPLQIAMQDFATVFNGSQEKGKESDTDKEGS